VPGLDFRGQLFLVLQPEQLGLKVGILHFNHAFALAHTGAFAKMNFPNLSRYFASQVHGFLGKQGSGRWNAESRGAGASTIPSAVRIFPPDPAALDDPDFWGACVIL